jgi:hypothetical protein
MFGQTASQTASLGPLPVRLLAWIISRDIALQMMNRLFVRRDNPLHQIAYGNDAPKLAF